MRESIGSILMVGIRVVISCEAGSGELGVWSASGEERSDRLSNSFLYTDEMTNIYYYSSNVVSIRNKTATD